MFTFGFFTTSIPYMLLALSSLFFFITSKIDADLMDKWFSIETSIEAESDSNISDLIACFHFEKIADCGEQKHLSKPIEHYKPTNTIEQPEAKLRAKQAHTIPLPRPPNA